MYNHQKRKVPYYYSKKNVILKHVLFQFSGSTIFSYSPTLCPCNRYDRATSEYTGPCLVIMWILNQMF